MATTHSSSPLHSPQDTHHRIAIYARVSTLHNQNPEMQLAELREYASRRGWKVTAEYVDVGVSGSKESRPELNRMLAAAHSRTFDAVVCWKLDRLGRSLKHLVTTIEDLSAYGVAFISLRDNLDLSTPSGRLMMHIIGAMAQFERELIKERVSAGMHAARKRGSRIGRPRTYANADQIRALRAQDVPWRVIAKQLGNLHRYGRASGPVNPSRRKITCLLILSTHRLLLPRPPRCGCWRTAGP